MNQEFKELEDFQDKIKTKITNLNKKIVDLEIENQELKSQNQILTSFSIGSLISIIIIIGVGICLL